MVYSKSIKQGLAWLLSFVLVLSVLAGVPLFRFTARAADASDYPMLATGAYTATARVDESIGMRASASIDTAVGITPMETRLPGYRANGTVSATSNGILPLRVTPYTRYTLTQVVVAAIATITHTDGTKDAVKDIKTYGPLSVTSTVSGGLQTWTDSYTVPSFVSYVKSGDTIDVEIVMYADFSYQTLTRNDCVAEINLAATGTAPVVTALVTGGATGISGTSTITINTSQITGPVWVTGSSVKTRQIYVMGGTGANNRRLDIVLSDAKIINGYDATLTNYTTIASGNYSGGPSFTQLVTTSQNTAGSYNRITAGTRSGSWSAFTIANADVYMTLTGTTAGRDSNGYNNVLANVGVSASSTNAGQGIYVDASASIIFTDASDSNLYARGGTCGAAIGSQSDANPCGFIEIDGGEIAAISAFLNHNFSGIGNGGHYGDSNAVNDPGIRGFVMNGGSVNALGFHYGIGGNGGGGTTPNPISQGTGPAYLIVTGGSVISEASAGSGGAAFGFAHNNSEHEVRIGRPDKNNSSSNVTAVNWGYGAAISGKMTFYSGATEAYSGQYSAAIGGNAVSRATTSDATAAQAQTGGSQVAGTPLTVYGGNVTAEAGAFTQGGYNSGANSTNGNGALANYSGIRGGNATNVRNTWDDFKTNGETRPATSYGAAIGGAVSKEGGSTNYIFAGTFDVRSSVYGAGIGGGGAFNAAQSPTTSNRVPISGGTTWLGNLYDNNAPGAPNTVANMNFKITSATYGAGIGGGGSSTGAAGDGGNLYISGGSFDIQSGLYGAGIGGGGSQGNAGGNGGNVVISGGNKFEVKSGLYGAGIGGGGGLNGGNGGNLLISGDTFGSVLIESGLYGAGIGGGGSETGNGGSGGDVYIDSVTDLNKLARHDPGNPLADASGIVASTYSFEIKSGQFGAGIGGGGTGGGASGTGTAGAGANTLTINGGNFGITAGGSTLPGAFNPSAYGGSNSSYGAGIGGGGSYSGTGGNGPTTAIINGGYFNVFSEGYGAAIGGGGSHTGTAGLGGTAEYRGGTVVVEVPDGVGSVGMGGGHSYSSALSKTTDGKVTITGGNVATTIASWIDFDPTQHALTLPNPDGRADGLGLPRTSTGMAIMVETPISEVGKPVNDVYFNFHSSGYFGYGNNDMYITAGTNSSGNKVGIAWVWVPTDLQLTYDLTSGLPSGAYNDIPGTTLQNDFDISHAERGAVGYTFVEMKGTLQKYQYYGDNLPLLAYNELIRGDLSYVGADWGDWNPTANFHAGAGYPLFQLLEHAPVGGVDVYFIGWSDAKVMEADGVTEHIFAKEDDQILWDYKTYLVQNDVANFTIADITVYAMWGYDKNGNGVPDVVEGGYKLAYSGNVVSTDPQPSLIPANNNQYTTGENAPLSNNIPTRPGYVFIAWTDVPTLDLDISTPDNIFQTSTLPDLYLGGTGTRTFTGTVDAGGTTTITAPNAYTFFGSSMTLYALWATDENGNGTPDFLEPKRLLQHNGNSATATSVPADIIYVDGVIGESDTFAGMVPGMTNGFPNIFVGWTEDAAFSAAHALLTRNDVGIILPTDIDQPTITLAAAFSGSDKTVYAIWAADENGNTTPDYLEGGYRFLYDEKTGDFVDGKPDDPSNYLQGDFVDAANDANLWDYDTGGAQPTDPYMKRNGWVFLGWLENELNIAGLIDHDFTVADATAYLSANSDYPDAHLPFLTDPANPASALQIASGDLSIYAVWGRDSNNNGVPDWYDKDGRKIQYVPNSPVSSAVDPTSMPFYDAATPGIYIDYGPSAGSDFTGYTSNETVQVSTIVPTAPGYVFMGWSPLYVLGVEFSDINMSDLFRLFALIEDIPTGTDNKSDMNMITAANVAYGQAKYTINPGLEGIYASLAASGNTNPVLNTAYGSFNWVNYFANNFSEMGFLETVTFDAFNQIKDAIGGDAYAETWALQAIWAEDVNGNGIPDMFETKYSLYYDVMNGTGGPPNELKKYATGDWAPYSTTPLPGMLDINNNAMIFLGWTAATRGQDGSPLQPYYSAGEAAKIPEIGSGTRFGNFDITVYAVWLEDLDQNGKPDAFEGGVTLKYDANGGSGAPAVKSYTYGDQVTTAAQGAMTEPATHAGAAFQGWNTQADGMGTAYAASSTFIITRDMTLYAQWDIDCEVLYDANGGSNAPIDPQSKYRYQSTVAVLNEGAMTAPIGQVFAGWNTQANGMGTTYAPGDLFTITDDMTLYARWVTSGTTYTVTYYNAGGGIGPVDPQSPYQAGNLVTVLSEAGMTPPAGYTMPFLGWVGLMNGNSNPYTSGGTFTITGDIVLTAQWTPMQGTVLLNVTYDANGGTNPPVDLQNYQAGDSVTVLGPGNMAAPATPTNLLFQNWNTAPDGSGTDYWPNGTFTITANMNPFILYAIWGTGGVQPPTTYTVTVIDSFAANSGAGNYVPGAVVTLNAGTRSGYTFNGWTVNIGGVSVVSNSFTMPANHVTVTANWTPSGGGGGGGTGGGGGGGGGGGLSAQYTLSFVTNGGSAIASVTAAGGTTINLGSYKPTRSGYTFEGWYADAALTISVKNVTLTSDMTVYAKWVEADDVGDIDKDADYTLTFESNGGTPVASITAKWGTVIDLGKYRTIKIGYTFAGWYVDAELTQPVSGVTLTSDMTVYAKWVATDIPDQFVKYPHIAYIIGYQDGTVMPEANITRAEVAMIFYRIMTAEVREEGYAATNSFSDVEEGAWYNEAVSTLANMGIIKGYEDGTFRPNRTITRAEFATIAARYISEEYVGPNMFEDMEDHWAMEFVNRAAGYGWILGYEDGTFRPERNITRAEAMAMVNRVLKRLPETEDDLLEGMRTFSDNMDTAAWYYTVVQEAANSHDFEIKENGVNEYWIELLN